MRGFLYNLFGNSRWLAIWKRERVNRMFHSIRIKLLRLPLGIQLTFYGLVLASIVFLVFHFIPLNFSYWFITGGIVAIVSFNIFIYQTATDRNTVKPHILFGTMILIILLGHISLILFCSTAFLYLCYRFDLI